MIEVKTFSVNDFGENSFVLYNENKECIIIDPGFYYDNEKEEFKSFIQNNSLMPKQIIGTHCHIDHILGVNFVKNEFKIPYLAHKNEKLLIDNAIQMAEMFGFSFSDPPKIDKFIDENNTILFGDSALNIIFVPGHSPGSLTFYSPENSFLIAGDVLFQGSIGRTDLPGGNYDTLISGIKNQLFTLPKDTIVYSGHGPSTTIGKELETNPFLL